MKTQIILAFAAATALSACDAKFGPPPNIDHEESGIWVSPEGCDSWYFEDRTGLFMSPRLNAAGKPVCSHAPMPPVASAAPVAAAPAATPGLDANTFGVN